MNSGVYNIEAPYHLLTIGIKSLAFRLIEIAKKIGYIFTKI